MHFDHRTNVSLYLFFGSLDLSMNVGSDSNQTLTAELTRWTLTPEFSHVHLPSAHRPHYKKYISKRIINLFLVISSSFRFIRLFVWRFPFSHSWPCNCTSVLRALCSVCPVCVLCMGNGTAAICSVGRWSIWCRWSWAEGRLLPLRFFRQRNFRFIYLLKISV